MTWDEVPHDDDLPRGMLFGRHSLVRLIALGGMAAVYEAEHLDLQKRVAIKIMRHAFSLDRSLVQRFVLEARTASRLRHPNVISVSDVGVEGGRPYMVIDLLEGENLSQAAHGADAMSLERITDIMLPVCSAVAAAHSEGVLHRDLKPENIFLARERGQRVRPVLLDFGISRVAEQKPEAFARALTKFGQTVGTPAYMAVEQLRGSADLDARSDQYSLGVILYECATQRLPFNGDALDTLVTAIAGGDAKKPSALRSDLPAEFDAVVMRAMSVDREERFESVRALGRALFPFASPVSQAIWGEEFGSPDLVLAPLSKPALRNYPKRQQTLGYVPAVTPVPVSEPRSGPRPGIPSKRAASKVEPLHPDQLRTFPAFEGCSDSDLQLLLTQSSSRRYEDGARILTQGAHGSGCFLLVSGEVQIVKSTSVGHWIVGTLHAGSVFGQIALVDHLPRTASVVAVGEVVVVQVARALFDDLLAASSPLALGLREQIAVSGIRQLRHATRRFAAILDQRTPVRTGTDPRRDLVYVQVAAREWDLAIDDDDDL